MPIGRVVVACLFLAVPIVASDALPRFTEEREAAALHFVRKHCPELVPALDELRRNARPMYERQVREIFQVTEMLADLRDDRDRYEHELKVWKAENRAFLLAARLATIKPADRKRIEESLQQLARERVDLDMRNLEMQTATLEVELRSARNELERLRENLEQSARERYDLLLERAQKRKKGG